MTTKKEYTLEGLGCASCASKMEREIKNLPGVAFAALNFTTCTLAIEADSRNIEELAEEAKKIISKIEDHVIVKEKLLNKMVKKVFILNGLDCANCATKIEFAIQKLPQVEKASLDFVQQKLVIEAKAQQTIHNLETEVKAIVERLEPHVSVIEQKSLKSNNPVVEKTQINFKILNIALGVLLYLSAVMFTFSSPVELGLYITSYGLIGGEIVIKAFRNIFKGQVFDENFLMTIATLGAFAIKEYPEAVAVMLFYQIGEFFQEVAVNRSRKSIKALLNIKPDFANIKHDSRLLQVDPEEVNIGEIIVVKPGERVPLDGVIVEGQSMLDTSALTGESVPRMAKVGDNVLSGSINSTGLLTIKVTKEFSQSTIAKILDLVQNASNKKAPLENFITKFARFYTPSVVVTALAIAFIPPLLINNASFSDWFYRGLIFLVISCPCALVVSIPLGFFGGIGGASKNGILIKGGNYLEALNNVETIVFDKTGTLTKGVFKVTDIVPANNYDKATIHSVAAKAELYSTHPIAKSILESFSGSINSEEINSTEEIAGQGIKAEIAGKKVLVGNKKLLATANIIVQEPTSLDTIVHVAIEQKYAGYLVISDVTKEDSPQAIKDLKTIGIKEIVMLTGDNKTVASQVSQELQIDSFYAELLPHEKVEKLEEIMTANPKGKILFVGDGLNDAPVLARADIGVAMGGLGSDAAIEVADVVIMTDEPSKLVTAIKIAKRTKVIIWQNIVFSLGVKGVVLLLGAGGLATMWEAVFADVGVAVIAVLNAMRVMKTDGV